MRSTQIVEALIRIYSKELAWVTRELEKTEKQRAFLLQQRKTFEDLLHELRLCLKD